MPKRVQKTEKEQKKDSRERSSRTMLLDAIMPYWRDFQMRHAIESGSWNSRLLAGAMIVSMVLLLLPVVGRLLGWGVTIMLRRVLKKNDKVAVSIGGISLFPSPRLFNVMVATSVSCMPFVCGVAWRARN